MSFLKQTKYMIIVFLAGGILMLLFRLFLGDNSDFEVANELTNRSFDESVDRLNAARIILLIWEFFWLTAVTIGFLWLARNATGEAKPEVEERAERFEGKFFKIMIGVLAFTLILTLIIPAFIDNSPIPQYRDDDGATVIELESAQYGFFYDGFFMLNETILTLESGTKYVFKITSRDTTHGFGVYNDDSTLILQSQIVPEHTTSVVHVFEDPGIYTIRCMEYCGTGHHGMVAQFTVT